MLDPFAVLTQENCMPGTRPAKWNQPKFFRLRGTAADGVTITLGRYETAEQANADRESFAAQGGYRNLAVEPIEQKPEPAPVEGAVPQRRGFSRGR
jgi:hypothetical protein